MDKERDEVFEGIYKILEPTFQTFIHQGTLLEIEAMDPSKLLTPKKILMESREKQYMKAMKDIYMQNQQSLAIGFDLIKEDMANLPQVERDEIQAEIDHAASVLKDNPFLDFDESQEEAKAETHQEALKLSDKTMKYFYNVGNKYYEEGQYDKSETIYDILSTLNPFVSEFWIEKGRCNYRLSLYDKALIDFAMATLVDPDNAWSRVFSAHSYIKIGNIDDAQIELEELITISNAHPEYEMSEEIKVLTSEISQSINKT